jgi:N6-L-threonylcarbamoyladenine synthase
MEKIPETDLPDIAASFQKAVIKALVQKTEKAIQNYDLKSISLVGGVAANKKLGEEFSMLAEQYQKKLVIPAFEFCGDNAAMIAFRGARLYEAGINNELDYGAYPGLPKNYFS